MDVTVSSVPQRKRSTAVLQCPSVKKSKNLPSNYREQGQCRCCHAEGNFRPMKMRLQYGIGNFKSYTEMLRVAFNISLAQIRLNGKEKSELICSTCIVRLREAYKFCLHVRESEETFLITLPPGAELSVNMESIDDSEKRDSIHTNLIVLDGKSVDEHAEVGANTEVIGVNADTVDVNLQGVLKSEPNEVNVEYVDVNAEAIETKEVESEKETMNALFEIDKIEHGIDNLYELFTDYDKLNNPAIPRELSKELHIPKNHEIKTESEDQNEFADITVTCTPFAVKNEFVNELTTNKPITIDLNNSDCDKHLYININDPLDTLITNFNDITDNTVIKIEDYENYDTPVVATDTVKIKIEKDNHMSNGIQIKVDKVSIESDKEISVTEPSFVEEVATTEMDIDVAEATDTKLNFAEDFTTTIDLEDEEIKVVINYERKGKAIMNKEKEENVTVDTTKTDIDGENVHVIFEDLPQKIDYKKPFHCRYCNKRFQLRRELNAHTKDCNEIKIRGQSLKCPFCAVVVNGNFQDMSEHMRSAHGQPAIMHKVETTAKPSTGQEPSSKSTYTCDKCSLGFEDLEEFQSHKKKIHPVLCLKCLGTFSSNASLTAHMVLTHPYDCRSCGDFFDHYGHLQQHKRQIHEAEYSCGHCVKVFHQKSRLVKHELEKHFRMEFPCAHCDHKAPSKPELYKHVLVNHKNVTENEFSCRLCEKKFCYKTTLKRHFSTAHPAETFE